MFNYRLNVVTFYSNEIKDEIDYFFDSFDETLDFIKKENKDNYKKIFSLTREKLVYSHNNKLPDPDGFNSFFKEDIYNERYKIKNPIPAKVSDYKENIDKDSESFKIRYAFLEERIEYLVKERIQYFRVTYATYNARSLKEAKEMLRAHTKSKDFYEVELWQCEKLDINEFLKSND